MDERVRVVMAIVQPPENYAAVMSMSADKPIYENHGHIDYHCGDCEAVVLRGVSFKHARSLVFRCSCGGYNVLP